MNKSYASRAGLTLETEPKRSRNNAITRSKPLVPMVLLPNLVIIRIADDDDDGQINTYCEYELSLLVRQHDAIERNWDLQRQFLQADRSYCCRIQTLTIC